MSRMRIATVGLLLASIASAAFAAVPEFAHEDGADALDEVAAWTSNALQFRDFEAVDTLAASYLRTGVRFLDGRPRLLGVASGVDEYCSKAGQAPGALEAVQSWRRRSPRSVLAPLTEACIWSASAWIARGPGYASSVSTEGRKLFVERLRRAETILLEAKGVSSVSPHWYIDLMEVRLGLGRSVAEQHSLFEAGIQKFPDYPSLYFQRLRIASPQWGGDERVLIPMLIRLTERAPPRSRDMLYARMSWFVQQTLEGDVFQRGVDWQRMKRGFNGMVAQYPASEWNRSAFTAFACLAGDEPVYRQLRSYLGTRLRPEPFVYTANLPYCDNRWAADKPVTPATLTSLRSELRKSVRVLKRECKIVNPKFVNPSFIRQLFSSDSGGAPYVGRSKTGMDSG